MRDYTSQKIVHIPALKIFLTVPGHICLLIQSRILTYIVLWSEIDQSSPPRAT